MLEEVLQGRLATTVARKRWRDIDDGAMHVSRHVRKLLTLYERLNHYINDEDIRKCHPGIWRATIERLWTRTKQLERIAWNVGEQDVRR